MACLVLGMLFYDSPRACLILFCFSPLFENRYKNSLIEKQRKELLEAFKDSLYTIAASAAAGRQMPRAIEDAAESARLFCGQNSRIASELTDISETYRKTNAGIEGLLSAFAVRSGIEEICLFAEACSICRRSGGDLEDVCIKSAYMLIEKIEYAQEAESVLSEKKLDMIILLAMPLLVLFFLNLSSEDYIAVLYVGLRGRIIMSLSLLTMAAACLWSFRIMRLEL